MPITPKTFVAANTFTVGAESFTAGDVVPHGRTLLFLLGFGDEFVTESVQPPKGKSTKEMKES